MSYDPLDSQEVRVIKSALENFVQPGKLNAAAKLLEGTFEGDLDAVREGARAWAHSVEAQKFRRPANVIGVLAALEAREKGTP
ncbi:MAG: hypothetical protein ABSB49_09795 [Polyangia bacterium]|jgi:hypothetical protein